MPFKVSRLSDDAIDDIYTLLRGENVMLFLTCRLWKKRKRTGGRAKHSGGDYEGGGETRQTSESPGRAAAEGKSWRQRFGEFGPFQRVSVPLDLNIQLWMAKWATLDWKGALFELETIVICLHWMLPFVVLENK